MSHPRLLVTGATGFVGKWVLRYWHRVHPEVELWATSEQPAPPPVPVAAYRQVDLREPQAARGLVSACRPSQVIHLGGLTGRATLADHLSVNVLGTENLYAALADCDPPADLKIVQAGSAAAYGLIRPEELPVTEEQLPRPVTAYGIAKAAQDLLAVAMGYTRGLRIIRACIFNILGPGQPESLVPMAFIKQLLTVRSGAADRLKVGNTAPRRDFVDVRDIAAAFDALLAHGRPGEAYNVASGRDVSIRELIDRLLAISGLSVPVETDPDRTRSVDVPCIRASVDKIRAEAGWQVSIEPERSLSDMWKCALDGGLQ